MSYYLGLDNGGTTTKASVFDSLGRELATASVSTDSFNPFPGHMERDMEQMWQANCQVIRCVVAQAEILPSQIAAVAVCGHGKGLYLWGKDGRPVRPGILSTDSRGAQLVKQWIADGTQDALRPLTRQGILACQPTVLLRWLQEQAPETAQKTQWVFSCKDYLRFRLTGVACAELTDLSGTGLLNLNTGDYDWEILQKLHLTDFAHAMPPVCRAAQVCGTITAESAEATGLIEGTPVAGGMFDIDACALAVGVTKPETLCMIAGTWSINEYVSTVLVEKDVMNSLFCLPEYYLIEASSPTSAGTLEWVIDTFLPDLRQQYGSGVYDCLTAMADSVPAQASCPLFYPYLVGGTGNAAARGMLAGMDAGHCREHLIRGVFEGIAFSHRYHFDRLVRAGGQWECIRLTGGAARSAFWAQMFADVMQMPVEAVSINECGTLGCAMAAAAAIGEYPDLHTAAANMMPQPIRYLPDTDRAAAYREKYRHYLCFFQAAEQDGRQGDV